MDTGIGNAESALDRELAKIGMNLTPEQKKALMAAQKADAKGGGKRMSAEEIEAKRPHVVKGSVRFDPVANKQKATITCQIPDCGVRRDVFTSDLFQVTTCEAHKDAARKAKADEKKRLLAQFKAAQAANKAVETPAEETEEASA